MKKILSIVLASIMVLGLAASAFAIHAEIPAETQAVVAKGTTQITLGGLIRTRAWYFKNRIGTAPDKMGSRSWYDQRFQLSVDAKVSDNVQGFIQFQGDDATYGGNNAKAMNNVAGTSFGNLASDIGIIQSWIQYKGTGLFGFNAGIKVGHMPLALGNQQFFQHTTNGDDAIVLFMDPTKALHVGLLTIKLAEDSLDTVTPGNADDMDAYVALMTYKLDDKNTVGANYTYINNSNSVTRHQNLGIHANGMVGGFGYKAEGDIQFGKESATTKYKGYAAMLNVNYNVKPVNVKAGLAYGSGNKPATANNERFVTYLSDVEHYTQVYEYRVRSASNTGLNQGLSNTTYYTLGVDFDATKDIKVSADGYILRASKALVAGQSKNVGWEVDAKLVYKVAKNLNYVLDAGYFKAGRFYDAIPGLAIADRSGVSLVRQQLILSF